MVRSKGTFHGDFSHLNIYGLENYCTVKHWLEEERFKITSTRVIVLKGVFSDMEEKLRINDSNLVF
jgi:hypothetical protein